MIKFTVLGIVICLTIMYWKLFDGLAPSSVLTSSSDASSSSFQLKQIYHHQTADDNKLFQLDITPEFVAENQMNVYDVEDWSRKESPWDISLGFKTQDLTLKRLKNRSVEFVESYLEFARLHGQDEVDKMSLDWVDDEIKAPNVTDKETVISLALMSSNAYVRTPGTGDWRDMGEGISNNTIGHGWNGTGLRGHVFTTQDESIVVISYKGTSAAYLSGSGEDDTVPSDKDNDNLLFSCCCARVSYMWTTVCDCYRSSYTCDQRCLEKELYRKDKYFHAALQVYREVAKKYPNSLIWATGHSLGGSLASLVGRTVGIPAVAFEAPGEMLATRRLHLPMPPGLPQYLEGIWHFGHTADPIFMGVCNGASSSCSVGGYALETQCHTGRQCVYDVVTDKGWHVNLLNHRIHTVIDDILEVYNETAPCIEVPPCRDCFNWNYVIDDDGKKKKSKEKSSSSSSSSTSSTTMSRTTSTVSVQPTDEPKCKKWTWYGRCIEY